jgi:hypothetical protein
MACSERVGISFGSSSMALKRASNWGLPRAGPRDEGPEDELRGVDAESVLAKAARVLRY